MEGTCVELESSLPRAQGHDYLLISAQKVLF